MPCLLRVGLTAEKAVSIKRVHLVYSNPSAPNPPNMDDHDHDLNSQQQSHGPSGFLQDTPPRADVDEILRRKRKAREYKVSMGARLQTWLGLGERTVFNDDGYGYGYGHGCKMFFVYQIGLQNPAQ
jgi:hypothetical protein